MPLNKRDRVDHWRALAADALMAAAEAPDRRMREMLVSIAVVYDKLALRAEALCVLSPPTSNHRTKSERA
jgi:hypothetical protein